MSEWLSLLWSDRAEEGTVDWTPVRKPAVVESGKRLRPQESVLRAVLGARHTEGAAGLPARMGTVRPTRC